MAKKKRFSKAEKAKFLRPFRERLPRGLEPRQSFLLVCEGEKTEPNYFESINKLLPRNLLRLEIIGAGDNTLRIVDLAEDKVNLYKTDFHKDYDQVWVVFDRDSFPPDDFDNAIHRAEQLGYRCAVQVQNFL